MKIKTAMGILTVKDSNDTAFPGLSIYLDKKLVVVVECASLAKGNGPFETSLVVYSYEPGQDYPVNKCILPNSLFEK